MKTILRKIRDRIRPPKYGFFGSYKTWQDALANSHGYDSPKILEKVQTSLLKVKSGEAAYERDSAIFDQIQYSWPVLAGLLWIASKNENRLDVLDFGGSLGSSYFQNKGMLEHLKELKWNIVEQNNFVQAGKKHFEDDCLKFHLSVEDCLKSAKPHVFLASSVIQYLEKPYEFIEKLLGYGFEYLIFDRTMFLEHSDRIAVQKVRPGIYDASYPAWFLNRDTFIAILEKKYRLVSEFDSLSKSKGFIFELRTASDRQRA